MHVGWRKGVLRYERIIMAQSAQGVEESPHSRDHRGRVRELTASATCARGPPVAKFQFSRTY